MKFSAAFLGLATLLSASTISQAQTYPTREIKVVVGLPAGSGGDVVARFYADQ
jgi:tripartite-type tricarboxylate transporter receptor subunit TctC